MRLPAASRVYIKYICRTIFHPLRTNFFKKLKIIVLLPPYRDKDEAGGRVGRQLVLVDGEEVVGGLGHGLIVHSSLVDYQGKVSKRKGEGNRLTCRRHSVSCWVGSNTTNRLLFIRTTDQMDINGQCQQKAFGPIKSLYSAKFSF